MQVKLYDGWNYARLMIERDMTQLTPRRVFEQMFEPGLHIWCWDGANARQARQTVFPDYKAKRVPPKEDIYASILLLRDVLRCSPAFQIQVPGFEADDVIASLVEHYSPNPIQIFSNDFDLMALTAGRPNVVCGAKPKAGVAPENIQVFKTFVGDPSDNIPGVKGFGAKAWEAADKRVLANIALACLQDDKSALERLVPLMFREEIRGAERMKAWVKENSVLIAKMWIVTGFFPVRQDILTDHIERPIVDKAKAEAIFKEFLL